MQFVIQEEDDLYGLLLNGGDFIMLKYTVSFLLGSLLSCFLMFDISFRIAKPAGPGILALSLRVNKVFSSIFLFIKSFSY